MLHHTQLDGVKNPTQHFLEGQRDIFYFKHELFNALSYIKAANREKMMN